jgi:fimbrial chaperone protein
VIIWGSGGGSADLGVAEHRACPTCEKERPFKVLLQYKYAHLYYLRWVTKKAYFLACDVCHRGSPLDAKAVEAKLEKHPIPFMTRNGWTFLVGFLAVLLLPALAISVATVGKAKENEATMSPAVDQVKKSAATMTPLKDAFELARLAGNIDLVLPAFRKAELYVIVRPDPVDPGKQVFFLVPSPKGRPSVTVAESLDTLQSVSWPKRRMTGAQLLAELPPGQEIVIAYPDGGDYLNSEQLEWLRQQP